MLGWPHQLNAQELEQTLGDGEGQGSLVRCGPWDHKETDTLSHWTPNVRIPLFKGLFWCPYFFLPNTIHFVWQNTSLYSMPFMVSALYLWPGYFFTSTIQTRPSTSLWGKQGFESWYINFPFPDRLWWQRSLSTSFPTFISLSSLSWTLLCMLFLLMEGSCFAPSRVLV